MKTFTRLMATGVVLAAGGVTLAADCPNSSARVVYSGAASAPVGRYSYRSGYQGGAWRATTMAAPVQWMSPSGYTSHSASLGPERHLDFARARQHIRGW
jgi:hypothetical protein